MNKERLKRENYSRPNLKDILVINVIGLIIYLIIRFVKWSCNC